MVKSGRYKSQLAERAEDRESGHPLADEKTLRLTFGVCRNLNFSAFQLESLSQLVGMADTGLLLKHYCQLSKNIDSLSDGQARLAEGTDGQEDTLTTVTVSIAPHSGPYRGGRFDFELDISHHYPSFPPSVRALTKMYHPNVEFSGDEEDEDDGGVCLNLLDELWTSSMTLEDVVQGLLFLLHNPNLEDPLGSLFSGSDDEEEFLRNVRRSLRGGKVAGMQFQRNLLDGYESDCEEDENDDAPGDRDNLESTPDVLVEEGDQGEISISTEFLPARNTENESNLISSLDVITEEDENLENDASTEPGKLHNLPPLLPSLPTHLTQLAGSNEPSTDRERQLPLFSQLNAPLWSFDKMWTLSLSSTIRTIVLGVQRMSQPLVQRLDSSELDIH